MENKAKRISISDDDKYIKFKLEQEVDQFNILSLSLETTDIYQSFNADYGVLIGRVTANNGIGVPNAKVSIFIPITDEDKTNSDIYSVYPYESPRDKNVDGKRYNLLPRVGRKNSDGIVRPLQPFGSFPIKEEIYIDDVLLNVYKKYYKYSALTNNSGDYMMFGVPTGLQTVHMSVDITDIGEYSMIPASMITNLGYSEKLFTPDKTRIKESNDLEDLPHIETQEISVNVIPFWGDNTNFEIGITRQDFRVRANIVGSFVVFGNVFTDSELTTRGDDVEHSGIQLKELYVINEDRNYNNSIISKRVGKVTPKIYVYPSDSDDSEDVMLLGESEYSVFTEGGNFVVIVNCNRRKIINDELGNEIVVPDDYVGGVFTEFKGFMTFEYENSELPMNTITYLDDDNDKRAKTQQYRYKVKVPQKAKNGDSFTEDDENENTINWKSQHFLFKKNKYYTVSKFNGIVTNYENTVTSSVSSVGFIYKDIINKFVKNKYHFSVGSIINGKFIDSDDVEYDSDYLELPSNVFGLSDESPQLNGFGANWLNFSIYLPQSGQVVSNLNTLENEAGKKGVRTSTHFTANPKSMHFFVDNAQTIAGNTFNTKFMARSDINMTDFIEVPKTDIIAFEEQGNFGYKLTETELQNIGISGVYHNGLEQFCVLNGGGKMNGGMGNSTTDTNYYFFMGLKPYNCIKYVKKIGLV